LSADRPRVTLRELQTVYGLEDAYDLLEIRLVNAHNERVIAERERRDRERNR
jgi:hypothetical protein